ncbi:MAG: phage minor capsid protein, partial [Hungatella sp.]
REYTAYEATQRQRYLETNMRAQRQKAKLLQEAKADSEDVMLAKCKYQAQLDEYKAFSKKMGLPEQRERIYYDMKGRVAPSKEAYQAYLRGDTGTVDKNRLAQKTPKAAENWAKTHLGVKKTNYTSQSVEVVNMTNRALKRIYKENPILKDFVDEIEFKEMEATAQAGISIRNGRITTKLTFSPSKLTKEKEIQKLINEQVEYGHWTNKKGLYGIAKHESAHLTEYALTLKRYGVSKDTGGGDLSGAIKAIKSHEISKEIKNKALINCNLTDDYDIIKTKLCGYAAREGPGEFLAEAYSEHNPRKLAREVQRLFEEEMKK